MAEEVQSQSHGRSSDSDEDLELYTATGDLFGRLGSRRRRTLRAHWMRNHSRKATRAAKREFERLDWTRIQLAVTIRWLAGGNYLDIMVVHKISSTSFWRCIHK
jgi:hypothetical protein